MTTKITPSKIRAIPAKSLIFAEGVKALKMEIGA